MHRAVRGQSISIAASRGRVPARARNRSNSAHGHRHSAGRTEVEGVVERFSAAD
jgi:hypothetical protein